ncbi:uncharacterized protein [Euwallacea fornicatus]|uniref:uncharacterized protein isoform X2 n=1 Tax=Euwallacea fornicatus TaxID=995702 RepID=UPI00338ECEF9
MISDILNYIWLLFFRYVYDPERAIERKSSINSNDLLESPSTISLKKEDTQTNEMSDMQVSIPQSGAVATSANREEESESVEETTLTEVSKDLGDSKMHQKTATFEGQENTSLVEDHRTQKTESTKNVMQQETTTVSANKKDTIEDENIKNTRPQQNYYKPLPLDQVESYNEVKPFEPLKPFQPLKPFEPLKSFELAKKIEAERAVTIVKEPIIDEIESIYSDALAQIGNIGSKQRSPSQQLETPPLLDHTKLLDSSVDSNNNEQNSWLPLGYTPHKPLSPLKLSDLESSFTVLPEITLTSDNCSDLPKIVNNNQAEIKEESIKNSLKEIISDLDSYAEKDRELKQDGGGGILSSLKHDTLMQNHLSSHHSKQGQNKTWTATLPSRLPSKPPKYRPVSLPSESSLSQYWDQQINREVTEKYGSSKTEQDENAPPTKPIDLEKIFTPADGEQIQPKSGRKMFASSAFYEKGFHPTVEDQVKLAKRISSSLTDISNQKSKGLQMYVNRKKRSVKWVHEGEGRATTNKSELTCDGSGKKDPLKLVMNPAGQVHDINSLRKQGYTFDTALSPEVCLEIVKGLNSPKGKGAELFAKRRKRSEKWVVAETNGTRPPSTLPDVITPTPAPNLTPFTPPATNLPPPSYLPETQQRLAHKEKLDEIQEKFTRPRIKLIKSPWDAALETGSVEAAFEVEPTWPTKGNFVAPAVNSYEQALKDDNLASWTVPKTNGYGEQKSFAHNPAYNSQSINRIVDNLQKGAASNVDVYKPSLPQAWSSGSNTKLQYSSINAALDNIFASDRKEQRPTSPFPTIPDISQNPESLNHLASEVIRSVTPAFLEPRRDFQKEAEEELARKKEERAHSPFPSIPDVIIEQEVLKKDIQCFKENQEFQSSLGPPSPFPSVPDVTLNPEILEQDIVALRMSPIPFKVKSSISFDDAYEDTLLPPPEFMDDNSDKPFPTIPDISKYLAAEKQESILLRPIPTRQFVPVSLSDKKYELGCFSPVLDMTPKLLHPEFSFAVSGDAQVCERSFRGPTPDSRTIQSEMFESQGHFNARVKSPIQIFVPDENSASAGSINGNMETETSEPKHCDTHTKIMIEKVKVEQKDPKIEEHTRKLAIENNREKAEAIIYQQGCFNELKHIKKAYDVVDTYAIKGMTGIDIEYKDLTNEGTEGETAGKINGQDEVKLKEALPEPLSMNCGENGEREEEKKKAEMNVLNKSENMQLKDDLSLEIEPKICKKPPGAIIGARPLFGELNINDEFKKALVGKKKSWQEKRIKNSQSSRTIEHIQEPDKVHFQQTHLESTEEGTENCSLKTTVKSSEKAEIEMIKPSANEEIEKVFYEQNREVDLDFQVVNGQIIDPSTFVNGFHDMKQIPVSQVTSINHQPENNGSGDQNRKLSQSFTSEVDEEDYVKIPVKSLIQTFEQSIMPPMQYKQIREPLPDVVDKLAPSRSPNVKDFNKLKQAEEEFDSIYYVTSSKVRNSTYPTTENARLYSLEQSENSSFCKYSSQIAQHLSSQVSSSNEVGGACELQYQGPTTLLRPQQKAPVSSTYKPNAAVSVFTPKESSSPLPSLYTPAYNAHESLGYQNVYQQPPLQTYDDVILSAPLPPQRKFNLGGFPTYNTAARGWGQSGDIYKPLTFDKPPYSDF